ncbi:MAG: precorrin-6A/cobalt-precorrin-6A reductase [Clostridia bacterium]|nr:precorrin-6A/cobalt-precorrin-6A reductase [Clostridia bacterium]
MERYLIFGGTPESRETARMLRRRGKQVIISVTTEYARSLLPPGTLCHVGRLDADAMLQYIREVAPDRVVDATHPYAVVASQNILQCTQVLGIPCERVQFHNLDDAWRDAVEWVSSPEEVVYALRREPGNVLLGIGRDPLMDCGIRTEMPRLYPRVVPTPEAVDACLKMGFPQENIIAMTAPFSKTLTMALFDEKNITGVVVRDATDTNYLHEMVIPALERGAHVIMYRKKQA